MNFSFEKRILDSVVGGVSVLDIPRLDIHDIEKAHRFLQTYGYDLANEQDREKVWAIHRRAVTLIRENLLEGDESIPEVLTDPNQLRDIGYLMVYASTIDHSKNIMQKWSCAILRVMHVVVHLSNDLSRFFLDSIQEQILRPVQAHIHTDPALGGTFLRSAREQIKLHRFDIKPIKTSDSSVIKLLAKPNLVALNLMDNVGIRFVTRTRFDAFRVIRFLVDEHLVSFPHIIPDQSSNTLYPVNIFLEVMNELKGREAEVDAESLEALLDSRLKEAEQRAEYTLKENVFSSKTYRFIKFINRRLITTKMKDGDKEKDLSFFYPYEIQIMDYDTYINNISGPAAHDKYKERQCRAARRRIFGIRSEE